jgi:hypothetical protein
MLYLPVRQTDDRGPVAEIRKLADGRSTLLAYTALDRLADGCGVSQPWVVIPIEQLEEIKAAQPFDVVSLDVEVPTAYRRGGQLA